LGSPTVESPYFNTVAKHSYNVGKTLIINYRNAKLCEAVIKQWIEEYKIDGFRWDLTKDLHKTVRLQMRVALILTNKIE
jgi:pullulanase/glycogen debranching enzyme